MNDILQTYTFLADQITGDPLLNLTSAVAWLDPIWLEDDDPDDYDDEHDIIGTALRVMRRAFPDIYIDAVERIRAGATCNEIDNLICGAVSAKGIPLDNLEYISYGIPMDGFGVELESAEFYAEHPDLVPILALFGVRPEPDSYNVEVSEAAYRVGRAIALCLDEHPDQRYRELSCLMRFLWSFSGNTLVDWSYDMLFEIPPLSWSEEDVAFAIEIIEEADAIMASAQRGIQLLQSQPDVMAALEHNIKRSFRAVNRSQDDQINIKLKWPTISAELCAITDLECQVAEMASGVA